jgi:hypothetical protein
MGRGGGKDGALGTRRRALSDTDFQYCGVDIDYEHDNDRVIDLRVTGVSLERVALEAFGEQKNPLTGYALERLLRALSVYEPENWNIKVARGYYGEEVMGVKLNSAKASEVEKEANALCAMKPDEQVERALVLEYGYLLDSVVGKKWSVKEIDTRLLALGQESHYRALDTKAVDRYRGERKLPYAVTLPREDGRYRVIDGYHRSAAAIRDNLKSVLVIVGD